MSFIRLVAWTAIDSAMIKKCQKKLLSAKSFEHKNKSDLIPESDDKTNDLLSDIGQLNDYENTTEDAIQDQIMKDDNCFTPMPSNNEIIQMATEDSEIGKLIAKILKAKLEKIRIFEILII